MPVCKCCFTLWRGGHAKSTVSSSLGGSGLLSWDVFWHRAGQPLKAVNTGILFHQAKIEWTKGGYVFMSDAGREFQAFDFSVMIEEWLMTFFLFLLCRKCCWPDQLLTISVHQGQATQEDHIFSVLSSLLLERRMWYNLSCEIINAIHIILRQAADLMFLSYS